MRQEELTNTNGDQVFAEGLEGDSNNINQEVPRQAPGITRTPQNYTPDSNYPDIRKRNVILQYCCYTDFHDC